MKFYTIVKNPIKRIELISLAYKAGRAAVYNYPAAVCEREYPAKSFPCLGFDDTWINIHPPQEEKFLLDSGYVYYRPKQVKETFLKEIKAKQKQEIRDAIDNVVAVKAMKYIVDKKTGELTIVGIYRFNAK